MAYLQQGFLTHYTTNKLECVGQAITEAKLENTMYFAAGMLQKHNTPHPTLQKMELK